MALFGIGRLLQMSVSQILAHRHLCYFKTINFLQKWLQSSNIIYIVEFGIGLNCSRKIHSVPNRDKSYFKDLYPKHQAKWVQLNGKTLQVSKRSLSYLAKRDGCQIEPTCNVQPLGSQLAKLCYGPFPYKLNLKNENYFVLIIIDVQKLLFLNVCSCLQKLFQEATFLNIIFIYLK